MIFVTVGTQRFQFTRLFKEIDHLIETEVIKEPVLAQLGYTNYKAKHFKTIHMLPYEEMMKYYEAADIILSHGGTSSIIDALKLNKKVIAIPRKKQFHEHIDDHQNEISEAFKNLGMIEVVHDIKELGDVLKTTKAKEYKSFIFGNSKLIDSISNYLTTIK